MYICTLYYVVTIVTIAALQFYPDAHLAGFHLGLSLGEGGGGEDYSNTLNAFFIGKEYYRAH